ncbi:hypothetical protein GN278_01500 [Rhodobacteraceae bacterium Araon29]
MSDSTCHVIDGDTIVIGKQHIRFAGIDAPELNKPYGKQAKWALVELCKGQNVTAYLTGETSYDRVVAKCFLDDGRDLAAEMGTSQQRNVRSHGDQRKHLNCFDFSVIDFPCFGRHLTRLISGGEFRGCPGAFRRKSRTRRAC